MASQVPVKIPKTLPPLEVVVNAVVELIHTKSIFGLSILDLWPHTCNLERAWLTGSMVWSPAVLNIPARADADFDIIFADLGAALEFAGTAYAKLCDRHDPKMFKLSDNIFGGNKISDAVTGRGILDSWDLDSGFSVHEHIMSFKHDHERVAVNMSACRDDISAVIRLVRPDNHHNRERRTRPGSVNIIYGS